MIIPFHFGTPWGILDCLPEKTRGNYEINERSVLSDRLAHAARTKHSVIVSGDCMAAIPAQASAGGLPLIWYDAHGDFHTMETTQTGSLGGMPLAMLAGFGIPNFVNMCDVGLVTNIIHVGGSEFDPGEEERMESVDVECCHFIYPEAMKKIGQHHLHVDTDVIREIQMSSSIHPAPNGMSLATFWEQMDIVLPFTKVLSIKTPCPTKFGYDKDKFHVQELIRRFDALTH